IYFIAVAIAFFLPADVSLGFGLGPFLWALVVGILSTLFGIPMNGTLEGRSMWLGVNCRAFVVFGACVGLFIMLLYTGRHYYVNLFRGAFLKEKEPVEVYERWAARAVIFLFPAMVCYLAVIAHIPWLYAFLYVLISLIGSIVTARVIAETGLFHIQIMMFPCVLAWGFFGVRAIGLQHLLIMQLVSMVLLIDPREKLMPFVVNSLKLGEKESVKTGKLGLGMLAALIVGLAVALPVTLYLQYRFGLTNDGWAERMVPQFGFDNAASLKNRLQGQGLTLFDEKGAPGPALVGEGLRTLSPVKYVLPAFAGGLAITLLFSILRLRLSWWPLHPIMFALWATNHMPHFALSFLIGWFLKIIIMQYGGARMVDKVKPIMFGFMAGEILGAFLPCVVGIITWMITGKMPAVFRILPG
ncbi:MAG: hypothetical protein D6820_12660, partial [Lentisphaerae bacterium]